MFRGEKTAGNFKALHDFLLLFSKQEWRFRLGDTLSVCSSSRRWAASTSPAFSPHMLCTSAVSCLVARPSFPDCEQAPSEPQANLRAGMAASFKDFPHQTLLSCVLVSLSNGMEGAMKEMSSLHPCFPYQVGEEGSLFPVDVSYRGSSHV